MNKGVKKILGKFLSFKRPSAKKAGVAGSGLPEPKKGSLEPLRPGSEERYKALFEDSFVRRKNSFKLRMMALPLSLALHLTIAVLLVGLPLLGPGSLPQVHVYSAFLAPVPSPSTPPAPPKGSQSGSGRVTPVRNQPVVEPGKLVVPVEIPEDIADEQVTGFGDNRGVPWGVDYGEEKNVWNETFEKLIAEPVGKEEEPVRAIGEVRMPRLLRRVEPVYPEIARQARVEGVVILEATTDIYGRVQDVKVLRSVPLLDQAAIDAVRQWVYEPMVINGRPRSVVFTVTVIFRLK